MNSPTSMRLIHAIMSDAKRLLFHTVGLRNSLYKGRVSRKVVIGGFKEALQKENALLSRIKRTGLSDLVSHDAVNGFRRFLLYFWFIRHKRKLVKHSRAFRRSLKRSMRFFASGRPDQADEWLEQAGFHGEAAIKVLYRIAIRLNTACDTAETVQIQIQQGKKKM